MSEGRPLTQVDIVSYLKQHNLLRTGPRELLLWRMREHEAGRVVRCSPRAPVPQPPPLQFPEGLEHEPVAMFDPSMPATLLHIPMAVLKAHVLRHLNARDLLNLLRVSHFFYNATHDVLTQRARVTFGQADACPLALSCLYYYHGVIKNYGNVDPSDRHKCRKTSVSRALHVRQDDLPRHLDYHTVVEAISKSIARNGNMRSLRIVHMRQRQEEEALAAELLFVRSQMPGRVAQVSAALQAIGLEAPYTMVVESESKDDFHFAYEHMDSLLCIVYGWSLIDGMMRNLRAYIRMADNTYLKHVTSPIAGVRVKYVNIAMPLYKQHVLLHTTIDNTSPVGYYIRSVLAELEETRICGAIVPNDEIRARVVAHLFSRASLEDMYDLRLYTSAYGCLWDITDWTIRIVNIKCDDEQMSLRNPGIATWLDCNPHCAAVYRAEHRFVHAIKKA